MILTEINWSINSFSNTSNIHGIATIIIPRKLTFLEANKIEGDFAKIIENFSQIREVELDFSRNILIDSSGIGLLFKLVKKSKKNQIIIKIVNLQNSIRGALSLSGVDKIIPISSSLNGKRDIVCLESHATLMVTHPSVNSRIKRLIDILGSLVGLGITAILFLPIAVAILLESPGPIFFSQLRCGCMGKRFRIIKFRTMYVNAELKKKYVSNQASGAIFKNKQDPRVTRVGRFLRRISLDELPQFWNVLKGEMSLVGTRPPTLDEVDCYDLLAWQRLNVKTGMTGEWQVSGRSQIRDFQEVLNLDLKYQRKWSVLYDIKIILKTIFILFSRASGAC